MSYPTKEQALAAAFFTGEVGDQVVEHDSECERPLDDEGNCTCAFTVWQLTEDGWHVADFL